MFASLVDAVLDNATMVRWDLAMADVIHRRVTTGGLAFFNWVSRVGSPTTMTVLCVIGSCVLFVKRQREIMVVWISAFAGGAALETVLKVVVRRHRPEYARAELTSWSFSFPSGHATMATVGAAMLVGTLIVTGHLRTARSRVAASTAGAAFALIVGVSRIYLGVHFPSDVAGGYTIGAAWVTVCLIVARVTLEQRGFAAQIPK